MSTHGVPPSIPVSTSEFHSGLPLVRRLYITRVKNEWIACGPSEHPGHERNHMLDQHAVASAFVAAQLH